VTQAKNNDLLVKKLFHPESTQPTLFSSRLVNGLTFVCVLFMTIASLLLSKTNIQSWYAITILVLVVACVLGSIIIIWCQPQVTNIDTFKVVNFLPRKMTKLVF